MPRLYAGDVAPSFRTSDLFGNPVDLASLRGTHVLISFFRNAACALCNLRVHHLITHHAELARDGVGIVSVFESPADSMRRYVGRQDAPFPIVADPDARLYELFGVESSEEKVVATMTLPGTEQVVANAATLGFALTEEPGSNFLRMPADFLVSPDGVVLIAHYADYVWDHVPLESIRAQVGVGGTDALPQAQAA